MMFAPNKTKQPLCVAQVVETMGMGGAENLAVLIANSLASMGHDSNLIVITEPGVLSERIDPAVKVHYLSFHRGSIRNPINFFFSLWKGLGQISQIINANQIQLVQTHLPGSNFWGLLLALTKKCRVIATIHNNQEFKYGDSDNAFLTQLRKMAYRAIVSHCSGTVAVSEKVRHSLIEELRLPRRDSEKIFVVNNGVAIPELILSEDQDAIKKSLGLDGALPLVIAAGRFSEQKNFGDLITATGVLVAKGWEFNLIIAGVGELWQELKERVKAENLEGTIWLPGNLNNLNEVFLASDVFVMTSLWEGLPLVLLEAMSAGLPCVAYDIPGISELIDHGATGLVVPLGDIETYVNSLEILLNEKTRGQTMGQLARTKVSQQYDFSILLNTLLGLYVETLNPDEQ